MDVSHKSKRKSQFWDEGPQVAAVRKRKAAATSGKVQIPAESLSKRKRLQCGSPNTKGWQQQFGNCATVAVDASDPQEVDRSPTSHVKARERDNLFLLDIFCGTAGVAAAFKNLGGEALGIDHLIDKRRVKGPVSKVDLSKEEGQMTVLQWIADGKVDACMLAPPCGTASRAREIPLSKKLRERCGMQPAPLRSTKYPMGLPTLRGTGRLKVETANRLYNFTRRVIDLCLQLDIPFICENPRRSLMWLTDDFLDLHPKCRFQYIHACMYGSRRRKSTAFLMNFHASRLLAECDNSHEHLPWGVLEAQKTSPIKFATSCETEYPAPLAKELAFAFVEQLQIQGKQISSSQIAEDQLQRVGAGVQPRGNRSPLLLHEFKHKIDVLSRDTIVPASIAESALPPFGGIPIGAKLISSHNVVEMGENGEKKLCQRSTFGVYYSPSEFLDKAMSVEHPLDTPQLVDKSNLRAICFLRDHGDGHVAEFRSKQLKRFLERAKALQEPERTLQDSLDPDVRKVLKGKRLLLFKEMAEEAKVGDKLLFDELTSGFRLTGTMPESSQFPAKLKPAAISVQQLRESAVWAKKMIFASCKRVGKDLEIAKAVHEETLQQLDDGWVNGPFSFEQLDRKYDGCWIPSKRFGVRQGKKVRAVDDFSEFLINASVTSTEKLQLFGIDEVINTARTFLGSDFLHVVEGETEVRALPGLASFNGPWRSIQGRALDLKSAYKQLARHPDDGWASILAV